MREVKDNIWTDTDNRGVMMIGFTREFIDRKLGECFHVMPADYRQLKQGGTMLVLETNDGTERIRSPLSGTVLQFLDKARNMPDRLTDEDVILQVLPEGVKLPAAVKAAKKSVDLFNQEFMQNFQPQGWNTVPVPPQAQPRAQAEPQPRDELQAALERQRAILERQQIEREAQARRAARVPRRNPR